jgi:hypothetical protein
MRQNRRERQIQEMRRLGLPVDGLRKCVFWDSPHAILAFRIALLVFVRFGVCAQKPSLTHTPERPERQSTNRRRIVGLQTSRVCKELV